jgi:hypothetical protein
MPPNEEFPVIPKGISSSALVAPRTNLGGTPAFSLHLGASVFEGRGSFAAAERATQLSIEGIEFEALRTCFGFRLQYTYARARSGL